MSLFRLGSTIKMADSYTTGIHSDSAEIRRDSKNGRNNCAKGRRNHRDVRWDNVDDRGDKVLSGEFEREEETIQYLVA